MAETGPMHFVRYGRTFQLRIDQPEGLQHVLGLDDSLWVATSAPVVGLNCDVGFLDLVDIDDDGRIRCDEIRTAVSWTLTCLADTSRLAEGVDEVPLEAIDESNAQGEKLKQTARFVLETIGAPDATSIDLRQVSRYSENLQQSPINGDGVIPPAAAEQPGAAQFIRDVISVMGAEKDLTGRSGVTEAMLDSFLERARAYLEWKSEAELPEGVDKTEIMPLGEQTPDAFAAYRAVEGKVDAFFARCRLLRFNPQAAPRLGVQAGQPEPEDLKDASAIEEALARAPVAEPNADGLLPLETGVNPAYRQDLERFRRQVLRPVLGDEPPELSETQWQRVKDALQPHGHWLDRKAGEAVEPLGEETLRRYVSGDEEAAVRALLARDRRVAEQRSAVAQLRRLLLYHHYLWQLVNNFVSFPDLYDPQRRAMFEQGSLVIDGRWFNFAVKVEDREEHSKVARTSRIYVMYLKLMRAGLEEPLVVAVPATAGTQGNLCVGKRGVFYDTAGRHYDARIVQIIENPISFFEALVSPFVRLGRFISGKIEAISGSAEKELEAQLGKVTQKVEAGVQETVRSAPALAEEGRQPAAQASTSRRDLLMGASFSIAALSSAFAFITNQLTQVTWFQISVAVLVVLAVVFIPTAIVAAVKLRRRDLSAILEGCGWAINARMRLDRCQRTQFTQHRKYPPDATGTPRRRWLTVILVLILIVLLAVLAYQQSWL